MKLGIWCFVFIFFIYFFFLSNKFNSIDDKKCFKNLICSSTPSLSSCFFPSKSPYYYRPILFFSYIMDKKINQCSPYVMHLENVVIHTINCIIIFFVVKLLISYISLSNFNSSSVLFLSVLSASIFGLHPINTEAVNWISARGDLLAGFFCFFAFFVLIRFKNYLGVILSGILFLAGLLSKESAIGFIVFVFVFLLFLEKEVSFKHRFAFITIFIIFLGIYFMMRYPELRVWTYNSHLSSKITLNKIVPKGSAYNGFGSYIYCIGVFFKVIGFYFKKLFFPWPLNFAIVKINKTLYLFLGILILIGIVWLFIKERSLLFIGFWWSFSFMLISVLVPLRRLAWTPLAERYVYISSFGIALFISALYTYISSKYRKFFYIAFGIYIFIFTLTTAYRNYIWQDNYRLFLDTVKKSPDFGPIHNELAIALLEKGKLEEAKKHFEIAYRLTKKHPYNSIPMLNNILLISKKEDYRKVLARFDKLLKNTKEKAMRMEILKKAIHYIETLILEKKVKKEIYFLLYRKEIEYLEKLSKYIDYAFCNYRIGQLYLALGNKSKAAFYFKKAYNSASDKDYFKIPALKLYKKLTSTKN